MGYTLDDLKGISPTICQHAINIEPDAKPVIEHQRRLIPKMKDVVRNEVLKLLEAGIIYPIADSNRTSPCQAQGCSILHQSASKSPRFCLCPGSQQ